MDKTTDKMINDSPILRNKIFLYLTEFFSGMSVMAMELGASRLLAPYFSSSQIVWTIIIGTIMIAMAIGNVYGGKSADKHPDPDRLYRRVIIAAIWIAAIPVLGKYVIIGISGIVILSVGTSITFLIFSGIMLALGIIYFISRHSGKKIVSISMVLFILCSVFGHNDSFAFWDKDLKDMMSDTAINLQEYHAGGHIMTDDKAPVELLGMRAIDQIIGDQLIYYKEIYRTDGIRGLLDTLLE